MIFCKIYHYENFDLSSLSGDSMEVVIWGLCAGIILGTLLSIFYKTYTASLIKIMVKREINSEAKAATLREMKPMGEWYLRRALAHSDKPLRRLLVCANTEELDVPEPGKFKKFWYGKFLGTEIPIKLPVNDAKFYLPEENRIKAEMRFSEIRNPIMSFIFTAVILVAVALFAMYAVPELLQMLDNFLTSVKVPDNSVL